MSTGLVICNACKREAEQSIRRTDGGPNDWAHDDATPLCDGARARYPVEGEHVLCEASIGGARCTRRAIKLLPGREPWETIWTCGGDHQSPQRASVRDPSTGRRIGGSGNLRNHGCPCGSGKKRKRCCG